MRVTTTGSLERGRRAFERERWAEARALLEEADAQSTLDAEDIERLAFAAHLVGDEEEAINALERAHHAYLAAGETARAVRAAFWLTVTLMERGDVVRGGGWLGRARRLLEEDGSDCVERGYLLVPLALQSLGSGDFEGAERTFGEVSAVAERFEDADLIALGRLGRGQALVRLGSTEEGTSLLDEAMVAVTTERVSPTIVGVVYCTVIETCQSIFDLHRAQEWTAALSRWCDAQPDVVAFRGQCLTYRSEIMRLHGDWPDAMDEARRAQEILSRPPPHPAVGSTLYHQAEVHRLRGEFARAEEAYREANRWGRPPEPGLALLRLAQGRVDAAIAAMRRVLDEAQDRAARSRLLPAFVEVAVAAGDPTAARAAAAELASIAEDLDAPLLRAAAAQAEGAALFAEGDPRAALGPLRRAWSEWQALEVPYEAARVRVLIGRACRELGDADSAEMELDAARWAFRQLGAATELASVEALLGRARAQAAAGLTPREVEILRLVSAGKTNRSIAADLVISEKTVARHVSNILARLDLPSRAAATAYAYEHGLV